MSNYQANIITKNPATPTGPVQTGSAPGMWRMDEVSYWLKQGVWPTQGVTGADPYFPYVTMLLSTTSLGNANNNLFVDSSGAFNPISRNGNTTQGSVTPYSVNWSNYFDGSSTLTFSQINMAGDFTIEGWVYFIGTNNPTVLGANPPNHQSLRRLSGKHYFYREGVDITGTIAVPLNQWVHLAATRSSGTVRIFTNGVLDGSRTITGTFSLFCLGGVDTVNDRLTGYTSNMRVVNGTALYTATFTPPTAPLTAVSGTALLTSQSNRFRDASSNNLTFTVNGSPRVTDFAPFSPASPGITYNQSDITNWSGYFDGSGDYLSVADNAALDFGSDDFTIELWAYLTATGGSGRGLISKGTTTGASFLIFQGGTNELSFYASSNGSSWDIAGGNQFSSNIPLNTWHHVAVSRSGTTFRLFLNGALITSFTSSAALVNNASSVDIGTYGSLATSGYLSNVRLVKGTAVYTGTFTPPTTNLTAISGTSLLTLQNAAFTDNSTNNFVITPNGNVTVTGNSPFNTVGYWSNYFDGTGDYLTVPYTTALQFPGDFTVETWVYPTARLQTYPCIVSNYSTYGANGGFSIFAGHNSANTAKYQVAFNGSFPFIQSTSDIIYNSWSHIALIRSGSTITLYVNGVANGTATSSATVTGTANSWWVGTSGDVVSSGEFNGYMSNVRVVKGTAVYTSNFTPPTTPLTAISGTSLLTCQNGRFIDNSTNNFTITRNGDVSAQSFDPFYTSTIASNGGSMYFDGSGDYLLTPYSGNTIFGSANFTFEAWIYPTTTSSNCTIAALNNATSGGAYSGVRVDYAGSTQNAFMLISNAANSWQIISGTSSNTVPANSWSHIAVVRNGSSFTLYVNGVSSATGTYSGSINSYGAGNYIGAAWNGSAIEQPFFGYISNLRLVKGTAVYTSAFTPPTAPVTPTAATTLLLNGMNAGLYDATAINDMETVGNAQVTTAVSKYGGSSVYFDGTGDYLVVPNNAELQMGSGDFTIEFWWYPSSISGYQTPIEKGYTSSGGLLLQTGAGDGKIIVYASGSGVITASTAVTLSTWNHMALVRSGTSLVLYLNGTSVGSATNSTNFNNTGVMGIGANASGGGAGAYPINGYIDDLRVTKGYARYTSNFTPPTQAFPTY